MNFFQQDGLLSQRAFEPADQAFPFLMGLISFRDVADELREATKIPVLVSKSCNQDIGPKPRTIAAHSPSLFFEPALLPCDSQFLLRMTGIFCIWRIEARKMLP